MGVSRWLVAGTTLAVSMAGATPAWAAPDPPPPPAVSEEPGAAADVPEPEPEPQADIEFTAAPKETTPGATVVFTGVAGIIDRDSGNAGRVDFYFVRGQKGPRKFAGSATASNSGRFRWSTKATVSGDYIAEYRNRKLAIVANATEYLSVYTHRATDQKLYSWTAGKMSCLPACKTVGPEQFVDAAPIHVTLSRECLQPKSGGRIGFADSQQNAFKPGDPGWRDFPEGQGPAEFDLNPGLTRGRFYFEWTSAPAPAGELTQCNLSFTATQRIVRKVYL
ncbi:hypothetical protein [Actinoplanes couchii]|uniref:Secreted protein n=1 Tax=Actinoplanes couchii TaxID=403638 RepID=A0ABQ3X0R6_9ACTN|nr:hypothetical protein [Actinoplanes couchii]MDR6316435.1 hypothetical protein [Actinoplanes couchii]GID52049.1 hypothetical protein Aco03nite_004530 [Actinoplanes couchii]